LSQRNCAFRRTQPSYFSLHAVDVDRTKGKDRALELKVLGNNLNLDNKNLKKILNQKRSKMDNNTEKAKYIDWLLQDNEPNSKSASRKSSKSESNTKVTESNGGQPSFLSSEKFSDREDLHPDSKRALQQVFKIETMTEIQSKTYGVVSSGNDCLGRAKTGTGKTLAYLVPALSRILQHPPKKNCVGILVISPTRELASQIADQAEKLVTFHSDLNVQVVYGGTKVQRDINQFKRKIPTILVATPGRLLDHLASTVIDGRSFGKDIVSQTPLVVLDETDILLDLGSRREITKILSYLPPKERRQTLLFSATLPLDLKKIMEENMKKDFDKVDCINDGDADTNAGVCESHIVIPSMDRFVSSVVEIVHLATKEDPDAKIVAFFPTARMVAYFSELFNEGLKIPVIELHSKKSQGYRNRASETFRSASSAILFTSDVSARGVDYPGVSQVLQFGMPDSREQYIHRLGRTGRAGMEGKGWLVLAPFERQFLYELKGLDIPENQQLASLLADPMDNDVHSMLTAATDRIRSSNKRQTSAKGAYQAFLGAYLGKMKLLKMRRKEDLVAVANDFAFQMGLPEIPSLGSRMVGKMGLKGVTGITVKKESDDNNNNSYGRRQGGGPRKGNGMKKNARRRR